MKPKTYSAITRRHALALAGTITVLFSFPTAQAADRTKLDNTVTLNQATSWTGGVPTATDVGLWNNTVTGANAVALGADASWRGIRIANPGGAVTINPGNTLTLGGQGINMSAATADLTIQSGLALLGSSGQIWNIASGRTLTLNTGAFTRNPYSTFNVQGAGSVSTSTIANDATGIVGPWATIGTAAAAQYATVSAGNIIGYTGGSAALTAAGVTSTTGLVNYDVAGGAAAFGTGASFNTMRYIGTGGTLSGNFSTNGILTAGTGDLFLSGNLSIGANRELVVMNGDGTTSRRVTISGVVSDSGSGSSGITKGGDGALVLSGANTYSGVTTITRGVLQLTHGSGLGSTDAGTRLAGGGNSDNVADGYLFLIGGASGLNTPEPIYFDSNGGAVLLSATGDNTLSGPVRLNSSVRLGGGTNVYFTGGLSTTNGAYGGGTFLVFNLNATVTGKPIINGAGAFYLDQTQNRVIGVAGNTWGTTTLGNGSLRTDVANVLPPTTSLQMGTNGTLNLNGTSQLVAELKSSTFVAVAVERTISSATAATLTANQTSITTYDGKLTGAVSLVKNNTGTLNLSGPSTTTGTFTVNGGTLNLNFGRATASASGASTVSDYLPTTAVPVLGGGTLALTGRQDGTATPVTGTWTNNSSSITGMSPTTGLAPGQPISGTGIPAGAYIVAIETGIIGTGSRITISANTTAAGTGATITPTASTFTTSQTFNGLTLNPGASNVNVSANSAATPATVLNLGTITQNAGGTVNFTLPATLPAGSQSATNGITLNNTNTNGILGGWARVDNDWAVNSTNSAGGNVVALATYTDINRLGGSVTSAATSNVRFITGGASGSITPAAGGTTDVNTLLQTTTAGASTYDPGAADVLRVGTAGGIMVASNAGALTIGAAANDGKLTAGGTADTAGTVYLTSNNTTAANLLTVNSTITDNGTGVVGVTTSTTGSGTGGTVGSVITLAGTNTYTGKTVVGGTGIFNTGERLQISSEANLGTTPASFVADQLTLAGGTLRVTSATTLSANRGITVTGSNSFLDTQATVTVNGIISGTGILNKPGQSGAGHLVLNAANTFSGIMVNQATGNNSQLQLGNVNALQNATLDVSAYNNQSVAFTVAGTNTYNIGGLMGSDRIDIGANTISVGANNATTIYSGGNQYVQVAPAPVRPGLVGGGGLIKVGAGTLTLTGRNDHSGDTLVSGGMLVLAHADALINSTLDTGSAGSQSVNLTMNEGTTYNIGGLKGGNDLDMAVCNLSIGANNQTTTFSGSLKGAFGNNLTKVGGGTLTLAGANTYTGTTTVNGGTLELSGSNFFANDITVDAGIFTLTNTGSLKFSVTDSTNNRITGNGSGTAVLNGSFIINTSAVTATTGSWTLVDKSAVWGILDDPSFSVAGFTPDVDGVTWTRNEGSKQWTFSETTGVLTLAVGNTFNTWIDGYFTGVTDPAIIGAAADPDHDGIANGVEFVIGNLPNQAKVENLPTGVLVTNPVGVLAGDYLKFSYRRTTAAVDAGVTAAVQYSTDLGTWTTAVDGVSGVTIIETPNAGIPGTDVDVYIPRAANTKLFGRLSVVVP